MDFTREPIIETIITPKEGCKLVVRSSKSAGQEEYFVDSVEVISFGNALFFRSTERPKAFLVPASDYEVLEVREARMVLKNVGMNRTIKIGGGRETTGKTTREAQPEPIMPAETSVSPVAQDSGELTETKLGRMDKRREKRHHRRRRRGREEGATVSEETTEETTEKEGPSEPTISPVEPTTEGAAPAAPFFSSLLPPPTTLISETIARYRDNALFKEAFYVKDQEGGEEDSEDRESPIGTKPEHSDELLEALEMQKITLEPSAYGTFEDAVDDNIPEHRDVSYNNQRKEEENFPG